MKLSDIRPEVFELAERAQEKLSARFREIDRTAGVLLLPYLLWVGFAGYLNFGVWLLNR